MPFTFKRLSISDVILASPETFADKRGFFIEMYRQSSFKEHIDSVFVQDNYSHSTSRVLRGLHYQTNPKSQAKLVSVIRGEIFDVAVDLRQGSQTFGKWVSEILSEKNHNLLYIPDGFAHGFCVLSSAADVLYKTSQEYSLDHQRGIAWNDPSLNIKWPLDEPIISKQDLDLPSLGDAENNFIHYD